MVRNIIGIIIGITVAGVAIWFIQNISSSMFPFPEGLTVDDKEGMINHIKTLPPLAFILVMVAHIVGAFLGAWVASLIADNNQFRISMGIGLFLTVMGIATLISIPHPIWFSVIDTLCYLPAAYAGYLLFKSRNS